MIETDYIGRRCWLTCEVCGLKKFYDTDLNFWKMAEYAKEDGWTIKKDGNKKERLHYCPLCSVIKGKK